ncbi:MAG: Re/Si-specific NAD(P)(+) transhydrogenase subunit alpha [Myxococcota bacterium]
MRIGVPAEVSGSEARVALTPAIAAKLADKGFSIQVERGAGVAAGYLDDAYLEAGAELVDDAWTGADLVVKINPPADLDGGGHEADRLPEGAVLVSLVDPARNGPVLERLAARKATVLGLDQIPRISRAQSMDVLSSMANIAGYRAIVEAANSYGGFFGAQMTAAGKSPPAKVLVIGAGVAGLAAVGAARAMGATVRAFDVRPAVREQVESLGGAFLEVEIEESGDGGGGYAKTMSPEFIAAEMALFREQAKEVDVVITSALIPGKPAAKLYLADMVKMMKPGSVVVDLAAANGGNCDLTVPGQVIDHQGVTVIGYTDLTSRQPTVASQFFATNVYNLLVELGGGDGWILDHDNEVTRGALVLEHGQMTWPAPRKPAPPTPPPPEPEPEPKAVAAKPKKDNSGASAWASVILFSLGILLVGGFAPAGFLQHLTVFVLAVFIGWQVVWNVSHSLHTPLMAVTNAISGIILVGGILQAGTGNLDVAAILGAIAILFASINVVGGFVVTQRMLRMFRRA